MNLKCPENIFKNLNMYKKGDKGKKNFHAIDAEFLRHRFGLKSLEINTI